MEGKGFDVMKIDLLKGKLEDESLITGCKYEVISDYCCENMEVALVWDHLVSNGIELEIPEHADNEHDKPIMGGLTISHCPWCGEKIECINPWAPYWTEVKLNELCGGYYVYDKEYTNNLFISSTILGGLHEDMLPADRLHKIVKYLEEGCFEMPVWDPYQAMLIKLNDSFAFPPTGERIVGVKFSDAPFYDNKLLASFYCNEGMQECYIEDDFIWVREWDSDYINRFRYKWPYIMSLEWLE